MSMTIIENGVRVAAPAIPVETHTDAMHISDAKRGVASGVASLDASTLVPVAQIPQIIPAGVIFAYGAASAPAGYLLCDASAVSRTTYAALFAAIGTTYGAGDGLTTFNVPDFLGRTIIGAGSGSGLTARTRGTKSGAETHQLSIAEMPAHTHYYENSAGIYYMSQSGGAQPSTPAAQNTGSTGGDGYHNNMQPFGVASYIIKT